MVEYATFSPLHEIAMKKLPVLLFGLFLLGACAHNPIYNVQSHPVPLSAQALNLKQMENTII